MDGKNVNYVLLAVTIFLGFVSLSTGSIGLFGFVVSAYFLLLFY